MFICMLLLWASGVGTRLEHCDRIEINYSPSIEQVIFWQWNETYGRYDARGWCKLSDAIEMNDGVLVRGWRVKGPVIVTRTEYDPEVENRHLCPVPFRQLMPWDRCKPIVSPGE